MVIFTARQNLANLNEVKMNLIVNLRIWPGILYYSNAIVLIIKIYF